MNNRSTLGKVAIVCTAVLITGLILGGIGYALGGVRDFDKVSEKHSWIKGSPGDKVVTDETVEDFSSIEVTGDADVFAVTEKYYKNPSWLEDMKLLSSTELSSAGENKVVIVKGEKVADPEVSCENGVLRINAKENDHTGLSLNFSARDWTPAILICCPEKKLESVNINVDTGDLMFGGISCKECTIETDTGDIVMKDIKSQGQTIKSDTGDVSITGTLEGTSQIELDTGDFLYKTPAALADLTLDLKTDTGDIILSEDGNVSIELDDTEQSFKQSGGKDALTIDVDTGDIVIVCKAK